MRDASLTNLNRDHQLISSLQLRELWSKFDPKQTGLLDATQLPSLLLNIAELLHHSQCVMVSTSASLEKLGKIFDEFRSAGDIESMASDVLAHVKRVSVRATGITGKASSKLEFDSFQAYFFQHVYAKMMWELSK